MNINLIATIFLMLGLAACVVGMFVTQSGVMLLGFAVVAVGMLLLYGKGR